MIDGIIFCVIIIYVILIVSLVIGFWRLPTTEQRSMNPVTNFSVIIPFRDEATRLPALLHSITQLKYPNTKVSFWFIDDESEDTSCEIIQQFSDANPEINISILKNKRVSNSPKKDAIRTAVRQLQSDWVITTDADCILPPDWLCAFNQEIFLKQPKIIAAPVSYTNVDSFFEYFQLLDFLSLQGTTIGSFGWQIPFMCNGANLAYQKEAFLAVQGFAGNDTIASGDDVFLLEKFIKKWPHKVHYLKSKEAIVHTFPVDTVKDLISQRIRWASKSSKYSLFTGKFIGGVVILMNLAYCLFPLALLLTNISWELIVFGCISKLIVDGILLFQTLQFTGQKFRFMYVLLSSILYPFFTVFVFLKSLFTSYTWKNRTFKM